MVNPSPREYRIWKGGQFDRLDLQTLSGDETTILVSASLSGPLDPDAARRLWKLTRRDSLADSFTLGAASGSRALDGLALTSPTTWEPL